MKKATDMELAKDRITILEAQITHTLQRYDDELMLPRDERLCDVWEACMKYQNTNQMILENFGQFEVMLQAYHQDFWEERARLKKNLDELLNNPETEKSDVAKHRETYLACLTGYNKMINSLARTILLVAKEHRQAIYQSRFVVDVNKVQLMMSAFFAVIYKHVSNKALLKRLMKGLKEISELFNERPNTRNETIVDPDAGRDN